MIINKLIGVVALVLQFSLITNELIHPTLLPALQLARNAKQTLQTVSVCCLLIRRSHGSRHMGAPSNDFTIQEIIVCNILKVIKYTCNISLSAVV